MKTEKIKLTKEGLERLQLEYRTLLDVERPKITEELVEARKLGDLSENADYDSARDAQGKLEARIKEVQSMLENYELIKSTNGATKKVSIGNRVLIVDLSTKEKEEYEIVGKIEANVLENKISHDSPLARAILGKKVGDKVEVEAPKPYKVEIVEIKKS